MRDAKNLDTVDGMKYLASPPKGEVIVSMAVFDDNLYVATAEHLYKLVDDKRLELVEQIENTKPV